MLMPVQSQYIDNPVNQKMARLNTIQLPAAFQKRPLFGESTHEGATNKPNEDAHGAFSFDYGDEKSILLVVADGVTSESGSKLASQLTIDTIYQTIEAGIKTPPTSFAPNDIRRLLEQSVVLADKRIKDAARHNTSGMSTTVVAVLVIGNELYAAHVGDSRAYLYRDQVLHLLTRDHTYAEEMIQKGKLGREDAGKKTNRNVLTRYLGPGPIPEVDLDLIPLGVASENQPPADHIALQPGDAILLCSDGLTSQVTEEEISRIVHKNQRDLQQVAERLIGKALEKREPDNITAVLFRIPRQGENLLPSRGLLWLAGLLPLILLAAFFIARFSTALPSAMTTVSTEAAVAVQEGDAVETPTSQSPTESPMPTEASTSTNTPTPIPPTVTPIALIAGGSSVSENVESGRRTLQPIWELQPTPTVVGTVTPIPIQTSTTVPTLIPTVPLPTIVNSVALTRTLSQEESVEALQSEPQKLEIEVAENNGQYVVQFINPTSLPPQPEGLCIEIVVSNQEFVEAQKASEGLGKCGSEKSFARNSIKPGSNYVTLWQYELSSGKFLNLLSNQVRIDGGGNSSSSGRSCQLIDPNTGDCLD